MEVSWIFFEIVAVLFTIWWMRKPKGKKSLPGPTGLPIVGYIPFMTKKPYVQLTELSKMYGPVYSLPLGSKRILVLTDFKDIKEAFGKDDFGGRPPDTPFELSEESLRTKAFIGSPWKEQRRFCLHTFRGLGYGKTRMEEHLKEEILEVVDLMSLNVGRTIIMSDYLTASMSNNITSLLFGRRMRYDDPKRMQLNQQLGDTNKYAGSLSWQLFFPWIRAFMKHFAIGNQWKLTEAIAGSKAYCMEEINEHEATLNPNNIRDFVDGYLLEIQKRYSFPDTTFKKDVLADLSRAFFAAGSETVRISIDWMLLLCAAMPWVQSAIHMEIDEVLGPDRFPTGQDRFAMPFTEAAICEVMRWVTIVPLNVMRYTLEDTELNGYFIPEGTEVLAVLWAPHHDQSLWGEDVFEYKPERFLSADRTKVIKPEHFIPFSIGKRQCLGKSLGEIELFLYLTAILQKYELRLPPGKEADFEGILGVGLEPKRQEIFLSYRQ